MKRLLFALALLALAPLASSQIDSGYYTDGNGYTCRVEVSDTNGPSVPGVDITVTDAGGSVTVHGAQDPSSTAAKPTASSFPETTTPRGAESVRGNKGKAQKKNSAGRWVDMHKSKKKGGLPGRSGPSSPGEEGGSMPGPEGRPTL